MRTHADRPTSDRDAFTLIEMTVVIAIIGILLAFILAVSAQGLQSARVRATQALVTKLNVALEDRLEALLSLPVTPNGTHQYLASINPAGVTVGLNYFPWGLPSDQRAEAIARLDQIKAEFPDVFFYDRHNATHPLNFCAVPFDPLGTGGPSGTIRDQYILPLGNSIFPGYTPAGGSPPSGGYPSPPGGALDPDGDGTPNVGPGNYYTPNASMPVVNPLGTGIYGASYAAAASLYRLAGYTTQGCDGVDNNNNGIIDEMTEGFHDSNGNADGAAQAKFTNFTVAHQHKTARAEMLYALLVNGQGPLGSSFEAEDFTSNEVQDTDKDGVPEFVDAWGQPLQFYRWPIYHNSSPLQKGFQTYAVSEPRQTNPLDPDRQLTALSWWATPSPPTSGEVPMSPKARFISRNFISLIEDPTAIAAGGGFGSLWERSANPSNASSQPNYYERAYFTKFLINSSGPDLTPGYFVLDDGAIQGGTYTADQITMLLLVGNTTTTLDLGSLPCESRAAAYDPSPGVDISPGDDDIDNQGINSKSGGIQ